MRSIFMIILLSVGLNTWTGAALAQQLSVLSILCQGSRSAQVIIGGIGSGAKYVGATATLADDTYYDFPAETADVMSIARPMTFTVPSDLPRPVSFSASVWGGKEETQQKWSEKVRNHQGYIMKDKRSETVECRP